MLSINQPQRCGVHPIFGQGEVIKIRTAPIQPSAIGQNYLMSAA